MRKVLNALRECWSLPAETPTVQRLLLNRQLRSIFRMVPVYALAHAISGSALVLKMQPWLGKSALLWSVALCAVNLLWGLHAWLRARTARALGPLSLGFSDASLSAVLNGITALTFGLGLYALGSVPLDEPVRILLVSYVPGLLATGVLTNITLPMLSLTWLVTLVVCTCVALFRVPYLLHLETTLFLLWYAGFLALATLGVSRLLVWLFQTELQAEHERQTVSLLLGDFEADASDWLWETDRDGKLTRVGLQMSAALRRDRADLSGRAFAELFADERLLCAPSDGPIGAQTLRSLLNGQSAFRHVVVEAHIDGVPKSWRLSAKPLFTADGLQSGWRGVASDKTDARAREVDALIREQNLHRLATRDPLTGLPNRRAFTDHVAQVCDSDAARTSALLLVDLDNFKAVNDALGHSAGDLVLQHVASRLIDASQPGDFLCRLGGDEFALVLAGMPLSELDQELGARADSLLQRLRTPDAIHQYQIDVRGSIGATLMREPHRPYDDLLREADIALYQAKGAGRDAFRIYSASMGDIARQRLSIVSDLAAAIERDQLVVVYQCIVDLASLRVIGCEALLRWNHPVHGAIAPTVFIPIAEESGLIVPIGEWVLKQACTAASGWPAEMFVAVNLSPVQINHYSLAAQITDVVATSALAPQRLELEITESSIVRDNRIAKHVLGDLRRRGMRVALDDFGTGYSSMGQLRELPIDKIKLDRSFIAGLSGEAAAASAAIVSSLLGLCDLMKLQVTAEGVENAQEFAQLRRMSCQSVQGFYLARPMEAAALRDFLAANGGILDEPPVEFAAI